MATSLSSEDLRILEEFLDRNELAWMQAEAYMAELMGLEVGDDRLEEFRTMVSEFLDLLDHKLRRVDGTDAIKQKRHRKGRCTTLREMTSAERLGELLRAKSERDHRRRLHELSGPAPELTTLGDFDELPLHDDVPVDSLELDKNPAVCKIQPGCWMIGDHSDHGARSVLQRLIEMQPDAFVDEVDLTEEERYFAECNSPDDTDVPPLIVSDDPYDPLDSCLTRVHTDEEVYEIFRCGEGNKGFRRFKPRGETYA